MKINEKILLLRNQNHLSQEMLASQLQVSRQAVSKWEVGDALPDADKIIMISELFHVTTDWLLKDEYDEQSVETDVKSGISIMIVSIAGMLLSLFGAYICWRMWQLAIHIYICFSVQVIFFIVGWVWMINKHVDKKQIHQYLVISIWAIMPIPTYIVTKALLAFYPREYMFYTIYVLWFIVYVVISLFAMWLMKLLRKH